VDCSRIENKKEFQRKGTNVCIRVKQGGGSILGPLFPGEGTVMKTRSDSRSRGRRTEGAFYQVSQSPKKTGSPAGRSRRKIRERRFLDLLLSGTKEKRAVTLRVMTELCGKIEKGERSNASASKGPKWKTRLISRGATSHSIKRLQERIQQ